ncbi:type II toxin-antitoxin system PemK/MazF family toxin [Apilactobacillus sp. TMW 2.2459]|uniref:type II toxin-antitoxin system PemK/MazF family toxin n=1 Tax=Apilactobacillus xinyiensis TaxID=2841032 RepID=UPI00200CD55C|nr:type II toxin-antitoxin system PemK/MazF family toxin [Apilactobacillus xinyiensis]MCL0312844.1 type II toxin-antitoxin system PemK/MazF family toxin [Apilactobacillus xinyiensis]
MVNNIDRLKKNSKLALENYIKVMSNNPTNKKYRHLPDWVLGKSKYLLNDKKSYSSHRKVFKRGSLVFVDFGVNVGTELSGSHFAIILNKDDHRKNDKLTVLPLTSHSHFNTIPMEDTILERAQKDIIKNNIRAILLSLSNNILLFNKVSNQISKVNDSMLDLKQKVSYFSNETNISNLVKNIYDEYEKNIKVAEQLKKSFEENIDSLLGLIKDISTDKEYEFYKNKKHDKSWAEEFLLKESSGIDVSNTVFKINSVVHKYASSYCKKSYIKVSDITTISKSRLKRINEYDPVGKIRVSNELMDKIDKKIVDLYTK